MIETKIGKNVLQYKWEHEVPCLLGNELTIHYDIDISKTPRHVANFTFAMILYDTFLYASHEIIFDELTLKEKECIENHLEMAHASEGCCGKIRYEHPPMSKSPPKISAIKVVEDSTPEAGGTILVSNGFGKDALNSANFSGEMGFETRRFSVGKHMPDNVWNERVATTNKISKIKGFKSNLILTNFFEIRPYKYLGVRMTNIGFYPYFYGLPLAYAYNSKVILGAVEIHNSKVHEETMAPACAPESIFTEDYFTKATGVRFSSPLRAVTEYGSQKIFSERYPRLKHLQRSCDLGMPYCNRCSKCARTSLNLSTMGLDPNRIKLVQYKRNPLDLSFYHRHMNVDINVENKFRRKPYEAWVEGANENVFKHIWMGKALKNIISEHLPLYDEDPGLDDGGYLLAPSKWGKWLKRGIVYYMRNQNEA